MEKLPESNAEISCSRRQWLGQVGQGSLAVGAWLASGCSLFHGSHSAQRQGMRFGLVTYLWGQDLEFERLLQVLEESGLLGVELRSTHAHGVEPSLSATQRAEVRARLNDSPVELVGLGSDERFDSPDPEKLQRAIQQTKKFLQLSHDVGGTGVKVKPDSFHPDVEHSHTIEQIGRSLRALGPIAQDLGQEIRLEVHGQCSPPTIINQIMKVADHPAVRVCWNCNEQDLQGAGLRDNFALLRPYFGRTLHVRAMDRHNYPYDDLIRLLVASRYSGWALLEARGELPQDRALAMLQQRELFQQKTKQAAAQGTS